MYSISWYSSSSTKGTGLGFFFEAGILLGSKVSRTVLLTFPKGFLAGVAVTRLLEWRPAFSRIHSHYKQQIISFFTFLSQTTLGHFPAFRFPDSVWRTFKKSRHFESVCYWAMRMRNTTPFRLGTCWHCGAEIVMSGRAHPPELKKCVLMIKWCYNMCYYPLGIWTKDCNVSNYYYFDSVGVVNAGAVFKVWYIM